MSLRSLVLTPFQTDYLNEDSCLTEFNKGKSFILHEENGVRIMTKDSLIIEYGKALYVYLRYNNLTQQLKTIL